MFKKMDERTFDVFQLIWSTLLLIASFGILRAYSKKGF